MQILIHGIESVDWAWVERTKRSVGAVGERFVAMKTREELVAALEDANEPLWLIRAGAWLRRPGAWCRPGPSATGRPLIGMGSGEGWSVYIEPEAAREFGKLLGSGRAFERGLRVISQQRRFRTVPLHACEVLHSRRMRVLQVVTSLQSGGAERVVVDLAEGLEPLGLSAGVLPLWRPSRLAYETSREVISADLSGSGREERIREAGRVAVEWGADVVHLHLVAGSGISLLTTMGLPVVVTLHNMRAGWPADYSEETLKGASLVIGCAEAVSREAAGILAEVPVRTVWNGIRGSLYSPTEQDLEMRLRHREACGWGEHDFVLVSVANPRSQKRLHLLPEIAALLGERLSPRAVRLLIVGDGAPRSADGREALRIFEAEVDRWALRSDVRWIDATLNVRDWLAVADVFVSTSAWEGLSLAQLEALAAGLAVVASRVGGASEIAKESERFFALGPEVCPDEFVMTLELLAKAPPARVCSLPGTFTLQRMVARTRLLYAGAVVRSAVRGGRGSVWVLTNNFSMGGAQTSAGRLIKSWHGMGVEVCAATIEEFPEHPSTGAEALKQAGVRVEAIEPDRDPETVCYRLLERMAANPPRAIVFWNLITPVKVLLADALYPVSIHDVSPGEMYFASLERYFANPIAGVPCRSPREYGRLLTSVVVKFEGERAKAENVLGLAVRVIPNGVPVMDGPGRIRNSVWVLGTAARISPDKKLEELLAALAAASPRLPRWRLRIAGRVEPGAGPYARELGRMARGLPVEWCGAVNDMPRFFSRLDAFAMISEPAGCPNALLEALAAGLPVVATDHGGAGEQVIDGVTGRLVPRGDAGALAAALVELAGNRIQSENLGREARKHVARHFSLARMVERYSEVVLKP